MSGIAKKVKTVSFLFQRDNPSMHKARSLKKGFSEFGAAKLDQPAQSPDLNSIQLLWDDLEDQL